MQLIFHGGAQEVGRSCIELRTGGDRFLFDCGLKFHDHGFDYPAKLFEARAIDGVFLSHAHLDHSGALPFFSHYYMHCPIFCTKETERITKILLQDSWKISHIKHLCEAYDKSDMRSVFKNAKTVRFNEEKNYRSIKYTYLNAGHIPGSASVRIRAEGLTVLYSGDYNTESTQLMQPSDPGSWGDVDVFITEATYGARDHPNRMSVEETFLKHVEEVIGRGGRVLLPVFAVGRAQEILLLLAKKKWKVPIYMDGMAKKVTHVAVDEHSPYVRNHDQLKWMYEHIELISSNNHRETVADGPGIFLATSGMLSGGPAILYLESLWNDPKSAVLLNGYQSPGTAGWRLLNEGTFFVDGTVQKATCEVTQYDFSAHLSRTDIQEAIMKVKPRIVIFNHGDVQACEALSLWAKEHVGCQVYAPVVGDQIDISEKGEVSHQHVYDSDDGYRFPNEHQHGDSCTFAGHTNHVEHDD